MKPTDELAVLQTRLERLLAVHLDRSVAVTDLKRFSTGFSWITYGFSIDGAGIDGITELVLRIGPGNGLYAPYSALPQFQVLRALEGSAIPAPRALLWSDERDVFGDPWFVAEKSPGESPIPWTSQDDSHPAQREALGLQFADILGALHAHDWMPDDFGGLAAGLTVHNAAVREIDRWEADYHRWAMRPHPMMSRALGWLRSHTPVASRLSIIHGDYRLGNFLVVNGRITAILDWELVHLGDPHEDLAWVCLPQYRSGSTLMCKLVSRDELYARHEARTGQRIDPDSMRFYTVLSLVKLAATHIAAAYAFEQQGFHDLRMPAMGTQIAPTLRQIEKLLQANR